MYELKKLLKRHVEENSFKYMFLLFLFVVGVIGGFVFSRNVSGETSEVLQSDVGTFIDKFSEGVFNRGEIAKTSFLKTLRITLLIFLSGLSVWLIPVSLITLFFYGVSLGFTMGYLSVNFGGQGLGVALVSVFLVFLINIPIYILLGVVAFNNSGIKRRGRSSEGNFGLYTAVFVISFLISVIPVIADTFLIPWLIGLICG